MSDIKKVCQTCEYWSSPDKGLSGVCEKVLCVNERFYPEYFEEAPAAAYIFKPIEQWYDCKLVTGPEFSCLKWIRREDERERQLCKLAKNTVGIG